MTTEKYPLKLDDKNQEKPLALPKIDEEMVAKVPDELRQAWSKYMINGFKNNEKMFQSTLNAFMKPYNITILLYVVIFVIGILFFIVAVVLGFRGDQSVLAVGFGGLSIISFITFFIRQPVQALEENLEFISWLGVAFNSYWTRLMYISNKDNVQDEIKTVTDDFSSMVERLIDKHAKLRGERSSASNLTKSKDLLDKGEDF
jgi:ABC-type multidrug transport system fused ATPase/permease subunit